MDVTFGQMSGHLTPKLLCQYRREDTRPTKRWSTFGNADTPTNRDSSTSSVAQNRVGSVIEILKLDGVTDRS
jgi:hypothetical protein